MVAMDIGDIRCARFWMDMLEMFRDMWWEDRHSMMIYCRQMSKSWDMLIVKG